VQQLLDGSRTFHAASKVLPTRVGWKCIWRLLASGDLGFAEGYLAGEWSTPNIHSFLRAAGRRSNGGVIRGA